MTVYATPADVEAIWRPLTDAETQVALARIEQASRKIRREVPLVGGQTIDQRILAGTLDALDVTDVVVEMVHRVMALPGFIKQMSVTVDDATKSQTFDSAVASGVMFIAPAEMATLCGGATSSHGAFTITPGGSPDYAGTAQEALLAPWAPWGGQQPWT